MASREDTEYDSSSGEDLPETTKTFRSADLPFLSHPSPFNSSDSSSGSETSPSRPTTPASPATSLGASFPFVGLSSQTSEEQLFSTPQPKRKKYVKRRRPFQFKKGVTPFFKITSKSPETGRDTVTVERPTTSYTGTFGLQGKQRSAISNFPWMEWNPPKI